MYKSLSGTFRQPAVMTGLRVALLLGVVAAVLHRFDKLDSGATTFNVAPWGLMAVIALAPVNLSAEAMKWHVLMGRETFGFRRALAGVLNGLCTGFVTPNRLGDVVGRWRIAPRGLKHKAVATSVVGSTLQGLATIAGGIFGVLAYPYLPTLQWPASSDSSTWFGFLPYFLLAGGALAVAVSIRYFPGMRREMHHIFAAFRGVGRRIILRGWFWALARYCVFTCQFVASLYVFGFSGSWLDACAGVGLVFLIQSYMPGALFAEIGVREVAAVVVFAPFFAHPLYAVPAALSLWMVNVVLPIAYTAAIRPKWIRALGSR